MLATTTGTRSPFEGLYHPAVMPEYVAKVREVHKSILKFATLDPELPTWSEIRKGLRRRKWDLGGPMQAYAKPTGKERSMVYNEQSQKWEKAPVPEKAPTPEKGEPEETKRSSVQLKRGPEAGVDEPKAKKGSVASTKEPTKAIELKSASEVAKECCGRNQGCRKGRGDFQS